MDHHLNAGYIKIAPDRTRSECRKGIPNQVETRLIRRPSRSGDRFVEQQGDWGQHRDGSGPVWGLDVAIKYSNHESASGRDADTRVAKVREANAQSAIPSWRVRGRDLLTECLFVGFDCLFGRQ